MEEEEGTRVADTRISRIPVATSVNLYTVYLTGR